MKKISIITPSLNRKDMLDVAINSVLRQGYPNFEHIIIDGGSTDGTLDLIKKYKHIKSISENDNGMYDALNKGINLATGDIIGFLNTDDIYGEDIFYLVASQFLATEIFAVAGNAIVFVDTDGGERKIINRYFPNQMDLLESSTIGSNYFNAWFFHRSVFANIGKFDINYQIAGDRDLMFRFAFSGLKYITIDKITYQYRQHLGSLTFDDDINKRRASANDHLYMINKYKKKPDIPKEAILLLKKLQTRVTLEMAIRYIKLRDFKNVIKYLITGMKNDLFWLYKLGKILIQ